MASKGEGSDSQQQGAQPQGFAKRIFKEQQANPGSSRKQDKKPGVAQVPSTVLTVEYVDGTEGMESALRAMEERLRKLDELTNGMQETVSGLVNAVNQQAKEIGQFIRSINRRVDRVYREVSHALAGAVPVAGPAPAEQETFEMPKEHAEDPDHQKAWRTARVMAADLEEYYGDMVREGALYENFFELLEEPIAEARRTFQQRVPRKVVEQFDYLELALKELLARKKKQLAKEPDSQ